MCSSISSTMINAQSVSEKRMEKLVQILFERKWLSAVVADKAKAQSSQLCSQSSEEWLQLFTSFNWNKECLDVFTIKTLDPKRNSKRFY